MQAIELNAQARDIKQKARNIRHTGNIPAVLYNHGKTDHIQVDAKDIMHMFAHGVSESQLINIKLEGKSEAAFVKDYQVHPLSEEILHIDFYRITYGEKLRTYVPIHLVGKSVGEKEGGVLETFLHEVEVETYPKNMVASFEVDISHLEIGDSIHVEDIKLPEETKVLVEGNPIVCQISVSAKLSAKAAGEGSSTEEAAAAEAEAAEETEEG